MQITFDFPSYSKTFDLNPKTTLGQLALSFAKSASCPIDVISFYAYGKMIKDHTSVEIKTFKPDTHITVRYIVMSGRLPMKPFLVATSNNICVMDGINLIRPDFMSDLFLFKFMSSVKCISPLYAVSFTYNLMTSHGFCEWNDDQHYLCVRPKHALPMATYVTITLNGRSFISTEYITQPTLTDHNFTIFFDEHCEKNTEMTIESPSSTYDAAIDKPERTYLYTQPPVIDPMARIVIVHDSGLAVPVLLEKPITLDSLKRIIAAHPDCKTHEFDNIINIKSTIKGRDGEKYTCDIDSEYSVNLLNDNDVITYEIAHQIKKQRVY